MVYFHAPTRHVRGVHLGVEVADIAVRLQSVVVVVVGEVRGYFCSLNLASIGRQWRCGSSGSCGYFSAVASL